MNFAYDFVYYSVFSFVPFILYFIFFKRRNNDGSYIGADWFYPIKYLAAKIEVKSYNQKSKERVELLRDKLETEIQVDSVDNANWQSFFGTDQNGNNVSISIIIRTEKLIEARLCLRLANGHTYVLPDKTHIVLTSIPKDQWKVQGLSVEILEPYRRLRILFNGMLRNLGPEGTQHVEHVQFRFIFNSAASPVFIPQNLDENLLISSLATDVWKDGSWRNNLVNQIGFYQVGAMKGYVKTAKDADEITLNLACCRSRFNGEDDTHIIKRSLNVFIVDECGNLFNIVLRSLKNGCSQMNYGNVFLSTNKSVQLKGTDIRLENIVKNNGFPQHFVLHVIIKRKVFKCALDFQQAKQVTFTNNYNFIGYECKNLPAQCDVNSKPGYAVVEFRHNIPGNNKIPFKHRICELAFKTLPEVLVTDISSKNAQILQLSGGKGCSLALLASLDTQKFQIPHGFIVTVNAYKLHTESNASIKKSIEELNNVYCEVKSGSRDDQSETVTKLFRSTEMHPEVANAVKKYFDNYNNVESFGWAVRSSAIGEDSEDLSAAGQNETFLGCRTFDDVLQSVKKCWASLFKVQSVTYRWQHGLPINTDMAVVVQRMVPSDSAGVLFTCHPTTSNPSEMVITSNFGIGETVVSGDVDPDTFIVRQTDAGMEIIEKSKGTKGKKLELSDSAVEMVSHVSDAYSLGDDQILRLAKVGGFIEDVFGNHRDIEWAYYKDDLYLLQSRPITTLNTWTDSELTHEIDFPLLTEQSIFTVANIKEVMPNALTVLSSSTSALSIERSLQIYAHQNYDPMSTKGICYFQHNAFIDTINSIHQNATEDIKTVSLILDLAIFGHPVLNEEINDITLSRKGGPASGLHRAAQSIRVIKAAWQNRKTLERARNVLNELTFELNEDSSLEKMVETIDSSMDIVTEIALCHTKTTSASVFYQVVAINILLEGGNDITPDHYTDFAIILSSCEDVISAEVPLYLEKIAAEIRDNFDADEFCKLNEADGIEWINNHPSVKKTFDEFLRKHGHRSLNEFEVMEKSWREDQSTLIPMIQANAKHGKKSSKKHQTVDEVIENLKSPKKSSTRKVLKFLIGKMRNAVGIREQTKSEIVRAIDMLRQAYRVLATKLVKEGFLPNRNLIYHLSQYEIRQLVHYRNSNLVTKASRRQKLYPLWCQYKFPEISFGAPIPEKSEEDISHYAKINCVTGTPVCSGIIRARACVIGSLKEISQLQKGDILITYSTDIGWSPYFPMISGIVTELGGLVSHGAVVAREYGLPSLVGVKNVTKYFKTGDMVLLNGNKGELGKLQEQL